MHASDTPATSNSLLTCHAYSSTQQGSYFFALQGFLFKSSLYDVSVNKKHIILTSFVTILTGLRYMPVNWSFTYLRNLVVTNSNVHHLGWQSDN
jgi:hypothetical protein